MPVQLLERRERVFGAGSALFYTSPLTIVRGEGVSLFDADGRRYVDMYNNVPCVGHCHPHVVEAVSRQVATLNVHSRYLHESIVEYGERLTGLHGHGIDSVVFSCTGTEANEIALTTARIVTGGRGIVCTDAAYHGNSVAVRQLGACAVERRRLLAEGASECEPEGQAVREANCRRARKGALARPQDPHGEVRSIPFPQMLRCPANDPLAYYLDRLRETIAGFEADGIPFAGMLLCPLLANEGLPDIPPRFMPEAARLVREAGGVMVADEVQSGLCRAGRWWGYEVSGFMPDIVSMGKPLGAGVPLAATAASREHIEAFRKGTRYFNTFASSPLQAAAGNAVLDVIEGEGLRERAAAVGESMRVRLTEMAEGDGRMADVRGHGLFVAVEWVRDAPGMEPDRAGAGAVVNALKDRGFLIGSAGAFGNVLKIRPPLVFSGEDAESFLGAFEEAIASPTAA